MIIDESKVNLKERDIEDFLWENPQWVCFRDFAVDKWLKRQYTVPSGIIDLLGVTIHGDLVVVEVKNVAIDAAALSQVSRYAYDIYVVANYIFDQRKKDPLISPIVRRVVIGRSIDSQVMYAAEALRIDIIEFAVKLEMFATRPAWTRDFTEKRGESWGQMALDRDLIDAVELGIESVFGSEDPDLETHESQSSTEVSTEHIIADIEAALATE